MVVFLQPGFYQRQILLKKQADWSFSHTLLDRLVSQIFSFFAENTALFPNCSLKPQSASIMFQVHLGLTRKLQSEIPSGMCAKLRTVAASNNRHHPTRSLYYCLFVPRIYGCCSSRTFRSWWIAHSTQRHRRGCNSNKPQVQSGRKATLGISLMLFWVARGNCERWCRSR